MDLLKIYRNKKGAVSSSFIVMNIT
ncbi:hypothetical protein OENI_320009 [Oenococcus oeni]|nr:hypothetical protein OENI_320009 [Oenococcus oeni]